MDAQAANLATIETHGRIDEAIDCVRYGLMELGGFVRNTLFTQERANLVIWNLGNRAETTDAQTSDPMDNGEETEEKRPTHDAVIEPDSHASLDRAGPAGKHEKRSECGISEWALDRCFANIDSNFSPALCNSL